MDTSDKPVFRFSRCADCHEVFDLFDGLPAPQAGETEVRDEVPGEICAPCEAEREQWPGR